MKRDDLIDNREFEDHTVDFTFSHGPNFGTSIRIIVGIMLPVFLLALIVSIIDLNIIGVFVSLIFIIPTLYIITSYMGIQLCIHSKYFREYTSFLGIKYGKWKSGRGLTDVAILTIRKNKSVSSSFGSNPISIDSKETGIYFLIPTHRKRILVKVCKTKREAEELAKELANTLGKKFTVFSPKISEASKARRNR